MDITFSQDLETYKVGETEVENVFEITIQETIVELLVTQ